ncbi:MAG: 16S rRNA (adenine(1518)-N(6)/adenine(1519)-N(6))-dimethyltransferase RsmA [Pseudomonadota bacterium]
MTALGDLPPLRTLIKRFGLNARKSLGQHFLLDLNLTGRIARAAGDLSNGTVIEIGPGPGGLTRALVASGASRIFAIERDERCIDALQDLVTASSGRLTLIAEDATSVDTAALGAPPRFIVANLPYNISTVLLIDWLRVADAFAGLTLMFQKEVADRIVADPGSKRYGRLSVMANWLCDTRVVFNVPSRAFTPPPKVDSTVVQFTPLGEPRFPATWYAMEAVTAAAFGQRRKMLRGALKTLAADSDDLLREAGIEPSLRAEALTVEQFAALARAYTRANGTP